MTVPDVRVWMLICAGAVCCGQTPAAMPRCADARIERELVNVAERWRNGYNGGDSTAVAALYADDAVYLTQHFVDGIIAGKENIRAYVQLGVAAQYRVDSLDVLGSACSGEMAYVIARYRSTNGATKDTGYNLVVLRLIGGRWLIVAHEAAVPDPASAVRELRPQK